jgi:hypothetical protein
VVCDDESQGAERVVLHDSCLCSTRAKLFFLFLHFISFLFLGSLAICACGWHAFVPNMVISSIHVRSVMLALPFCTLTHKIPSRPPASRYTATLSTWISLGWGLSLQHRERALRVISHTYTVVCLHLSPI